MTEEATSATICYTELDLDRVLRVVERLYERVTERFPASNLRKVCRQVHATAKKTKKRVERVNTPIYFLRFISWLLIIMIVLGLATTLSTIDSSLATLSFAEIIQLTESGINDVVLIGAAIFFLYTIETRIQRTQILKYLHELRSLIHVIDMHQLTKDPGKFLMKGERTHSSPEEALTPFELSRYLDYCSELLSCVGKLAAIYAENFSDAAALASVNEVESLASGMSRKIWQKLMILHIYESHLQEKN